MTKYDDMETQITTTIEQSDLLHELGVDPNTADASFVTKPFSHDCAYLSLTPFANQRNHKLYGIKPAWSLHKLIDMLPQYYFVRSGSDIIMNETMYTKNEVILRQHFPNEPQRPLEFACSFKGYGSDVDEPTIFDAILQWIKYLIDNGIVNKSDLSLKNDLSLKTDFTLND